MNSHSPTFFSTCISGAEDIIASYLKSKPRSAFNIQSRSSGLFVYTSEYSLRDIRSLRFFNATYLLLQTIEGVSTVHDAISRIHTGSIRRNHIRPFIGKGRDRFIIRCYEGSSTVSVSPSALASLEKRIGSELGLRLFVKKPDVEFSVFLRDDGTAYFGLRLSYPHPTTKYAKRHKGQLRSELAHIMCLLSKPKPTDVVLDPFAGYGTLPHERSMSFPYKEIIAIEPDAESFRSLSRILSDRPRTTLIQGDFFDTTIDSVTTIITDPPWGHHNVTSNTFYGDMIARFDDILTADGTVVLVLDRTIELPLGDSFECETFADILVSGKKSRIYKLVRT